MAQTTVDQSTLFLGGNNFDGEGLLTVAGAGTISAGTYVVISDAQLGSQIKYKPLDNLLTGEIAGVVSVDVVAEGAGDVAFSRAINGDINITKLNAINTTQYDAIPAGGTAFVRTAMERQGFVGKNVESMGA